MKSFIKKVMSDKELLITYDDLLKVPIGEKTEMTKGFIVERLPTTKNVIFFRVELNKGVIIPVGIHDCFEEVGLYEGDVVEIQSNKSLSNIKNIKINPYDKHSFIALEDSVFYAHLYK